MFTPRAPEPWGAIIRDLEDRARTDAEMRTISAASFRKEIDELNAKLAAAEVEIDRLIGDQIVVKPCKICGDAFDGPVRRKTCGACIEEEIPK